MSGANHIVGGTVFTGIYLSMWDTNLFSHPIFLFFTAFFAVLPDIDHTKAPIGKLFYPIAKLLDKKFGHRTITHSLICYILLILLVGIIEAIVSEKRIITSIFVWSYGSHLIFDMVTKQGVPLFYPFKKNPCVIPSNPEYRFKSSDFRTETIVFMVFILLGFSCKPLFANGFWNTYNKTFNNIQHIQNEAKIFDGVINLNYEITQEGIRKKGSGKIIKAANNQILLFDKSFITITENDRIINLFPIRTKEHIIPHELNFSLISFDSLQHLISGKIIKTLNLTATLPITYTKDNTLQSGQTIQITNSYNPLFTTNEIDSIDLQTEKDIQLLNEAISTKQSIATYQKTLQKQKTEKTIEAYQKLTQIQKDLQSDDLDIKEQAVKNHKTALDQYNVLNADSLTSDVNLTSEYIRLSYLKSKLQIRKKQKITGYISYITFK